MNAKKVVQLGRAAGEIAEAVRQVISAGKIPVNGFLPSERAMAERYEVDKKTVRRALKALEEEGLVEAVERHGYRILTSGSATNRGNPLAYIPPFEENMANLGRPANLLLQALRDSANQRGRSLLAVGSQRSAADILQELRQVGVSGVILDNDKPDLVKALYNSGITTVAVDAWRDDVPIDAVIQDGQEGGILAVRHLVDAGCRRIAWLGPVEVSPHATDRFSGVATALNDARRGLPPELNIRAGESDMRDVLKAALAGPQRPDGICALWMGLVRDAAGVIRDAGLKLGKDIHLVGWSPEEAFDSDYRKQFNDGPIPPAVTWNVGAMAETGIARLMDRRDKPGMPAVRLRLPMKLMKG